MYSHTQTLTTWQSPCQHQLCLVLLSLLYLKSYLKVLKCWQEIWISWCKIRDGECTDIRARPLTSYWRCNFWLARRCTMKAAGPSEPACALDALCYLTTWKRGGNQFFFEPVMSFSVPEAAWSIKALLLWWLHPRVPHVKSTPQHSHQKLAHLTNAEHITLCHHDI